MGQGDGRGEVGGHFVDGGGEGDGGLREEVGFHDAGDHHYCVDGVRFDEVFGLGGEGFDVENVHLVCNVSCLID